MPLTVSARTRPRLSRLACLLACATFVLAVLPAAPAHAYVDCRSRTLQLDQHQQDARIDLTCTESSGRPLTYTFEREQADGTLSDQRTVNGRTTARFVPEDGFTGEGTVRYEVHDGSFATTKYAGVYVRRREVPVCPSTNTSIELRSGVDRSVVVGCTSPVGGDTNIEVMDAPAHGTATPDAATGDTVTYRANPGYEGFDRFTVRMRNAEGLSALVTIDATVSDAANVLPECSGLWSRTREGRPVELQIRCMDQDGDPVSVGVAEGGAPAHGTLGGWVPHGVYEAARVTYTPQAGFSGREDLRLAASDGRGQALLDVSVDVVAIADNTAPACHDQEASVDGAVHL